MIGSARADPHRARKGRDLLVDQFSDRARTRYIGAWLISLKKLLSARNNWDFGHSPAHSVAPDLKVEVLTGIKAGKTADASLNARLERPRNQKNHFVQRRVIASTTARMR